MASPPDDSQRSSERPVESARDGGALERTRRLLLVSKQLLLFTLVTLAATVAVFGIGLWFDRFPVSWFSFECGIIGGFVSIQQRMKRVSDEELLYLSQSWTAILIVPIFGGVFALVLYTLFLAGIVEGSLFPKIVIPSFSAIPPTITDLRRFFTETYPASGPDFAKLAFWCFVAGFSERLVPQIIQQVSDRGAQQAGADEPRSDPPPQAPPPSPDDRTPKRAKKLEATEGPERTA